MVTGMDPGRGRSGIVCSRACWGANLAGRRTGGRTGFIADVADVAAQPRHFIVDLAPRPQRLIDQGTITLEGGPVGRRLGRGLFRRRWLGSRRNTRSRRHNKGKDNTLNDRLPIRAN